MSVLITGLTFGKEQFENDLKAMGVVAKHIPIEDINDIYKSQNVISIVYQDGTYKGAFISRMLANGLRNDTASLIDIFPIGFTYKNIQLDNDILPGMDTDETFLESIQDLEFRDFETNQVYDGIISLFKSKEYSTMPPVVFNNSLFNLVFIMYIIKELDLEEFDVTFDFTSGIYSNFTNFYKGRIQMVYQPFKKGFLIGVDFQVDPDYSDDEVFQKDIEKATDCDYESLSLIEMEYNMDYFISLQDLDTLMVEKNHHLAFLQKMIDKCNQYVKNQWGDLKNITADDDSEFKY